MSDNAWKMVSLDIYESHMALSGVEQLQTLDLITKKQIETYPVESLIILGIAGGNGLNHIDPTRIKSVIGYDINPDFLSICKERFTNLNECLKLIHADLSKPDIVIPYANLLIANLIVEYIGVIQFTALIKTSNPQYVSCAVQVNTEAGFVSQSPYASNFNSISELHQDISPDDLREQMKCIQYNLIQSIKYDLPNGKYLLRLDYVKM